MIQMPEQDLLHDVVSDFVIVRDDDYKLAISFMNLFLDIKGFEKEKTLHGFSFRERDSKQLMYELSAPTTPENTVLKISPNIETEVTNVFALTMKYAPIEHDLQMDLNFYEFPDTLHVHNVSTNIGPSQMHKFSIGGFFRSDEDVLVPVEVGPVGAEVYAIQKNVNLEEVMMDTMHRFGVTFPYSVLYTDFQDAKNTEIKLYNF